jgi:hypothetical protein
MISQILCRPVHVRFFCRGTPIRCNRQRIDGWTASAKTVASSRVTTEGDTAFTEEALMHLLSRLLHRLPTALALILAGGALAASPEETSFLAENAAAMARMMAAMEIKPSGDVDADFVAMMVPHHQGAIDMALAELRYGNNDQLRRMAQEIIVTQQQEIAAMRLAVGQPSPAIGTATQPKSHQPMHMQRER